MIAFLIALALFALPIVGRVVRDMTKPLPPHRRSGFPKTPDQGN